MADEKEKLPSVRRQKYMFGYHIFHELVTYSDNSIRHKLIVDHEFFADARSSGWVDFEEIAKVNVGGMTFLVFTDHFRDTLGNCAQPLEFVCLFTAM